MKVKELKEMLKKFPDDTEMICYNGVCECDFMPGILTLVTKVSESKFIDEKGEEQSFYVKNESETDVYENGTKILFME